MKNASVSSTRPSCFQAICGSSLTSRCFDSHGASVAAAAVASTGPQDPSARFTLNCSHQRPSCAAAITRSVSFSIEIGAAKAATEPSTSKASKGAMRMSHLSS